MSTPMTDAECRRLLGVMLTFARAGDESTDAMRADAIAHALARLALLDDTESLRNCIAGIAVEEMANWKHARFEHADKFAQQIAQRAVEVWLEPDDALTGPAAP